MRTVALLIGIGLAACVAAQRPSPAPAQSRSILVKGGMVHVGDGRTFADGAVGFRNGLIDFVGYEYAVKSVYDTVIDAKGMRIYPGFILPDATLGLVEIDAVRATVDQQETGRMEPEVRTLSAYNADSRIIPTVRSNGVLLAQITPRGNVISGTSGIVQLDAWNNDDAVVHADDGIHLNWPVAFARTGWWAERGTTEKEGNAKREKALADIRAFFLRAKAYAALPAPEKIDLRLEAMRGLFMGEKSLYVHADGAREIQEAVLFVREMDVRHMVIVGGQDAWRVADLLRDKKVDVILQRIHSLPQREDEDVDLPYRMPALLKERGVRFCLGYSGDMERMGARNLGFLAGTASTYGLSVEDALRSITLDAAAILGIDDRYGSLEPGKSATLFISTGDALDMRTNMVTEAFIDGRHISMDNRQKALWRQYERRYGR
ncbi:MAG: amidohydrolase family protein [Flavobacteriales bacterium]|jgi:imidazolonepropionase-like amidohydrolase|nr:amidohydrolase family protein [Flavobacteriales bacterium]MCB0757978.1 amidohydrolase family protein [Flavobacteriales bacterium]